MNQTQLQTLKTDISANTAQINGVAIKDLPNNSDSNFAIATWYSVLNTPDYWGWRSAVSREEIYNETGPTGSNWDWTTYKGQGVAEQNAWVQMFMGDSANFGKLNLRVGIGKIFSGSGAPATQRDHCLSLGRRKVLRVEKLFGIAVVNPPANTGNNAADARGAATNPDVLGFEGAISGSDVTQARNLP